MRARAEAAAEPGGLAAAVAPPTRVRLALRPPPRVPPASVSGLGPARGAGQGVGPSPEAVGARVPGKAAGTPAGGRDIGDWAQSAPVHESVCVCIPGAWTVSLAWTSAGGWARLPLICRAFTVGAREYMCPRV